MCHCCVLSKWGQEEEFISHMIMTGAGEAFDLREEYNTYNHHSRWKKLVKKEQKGRSDGEQPVKTTERVFLAFQRSPAFPTRTLFQMDLNVSRLIFTKPINKCQGHISNQNHKKKVRNYVLNKTNKALII